MRRLSPPALLALALAVASLLLAACGGSGGDGKALEPEAKQETEGEAGGKLTVLAAGDVDSLDPAVAYYQFSYSVMNVAHKTLYQYAPDQTKEPTPDLAEGKPQISADGRTVTVKIKRGVKFSAPVNREVTSKDVKYAIERGFRKNVPAQYAFGYFGSLEGAPAEPVADPDIKGLQTPDDQTLVFKLSKPLGGVVAGALVLPLTAPVPEEYARKFDKESPSTYAMNQVFTGPYKVKTDESGELTGYQPKRRIQLVRNPAWNKATDFRPAYLDEIDIREGNDDTIAASRRIIKGQGLISGDYTIPPEVLQGATQTTPEQIVLAPSGGNRYITLNTAQAPFDDPNLRKAVVAAFDRDALRTTRGGPAIGEVATHIIPPEVPGFEEAGGVKGPPLDYLAKPKGDPAVAAKYFRAAGFKSGRYEGKDEILVVGDNDDPGNKTAQVAADQLRKLGFKLKTRFVPHEDLLTDVCGSPKSNVDVCINIGWLKDFNDPQTMLELTFRGTNIKPENNNNYSEFKDPEVDAAFAKAERLSDPAERAQAFGEIDRMIMEQAPVIPYLWDKQANARSKDVKGVTSKSNASWDYAFTSLDR